MTLLLAQVVTALNSPDGAHGSFCWGCKGWFKRLLQIAFWKTNIIAGQTLNIYNALFNPSNTHTHSSYCC